jgi:uronate dehydrogenase
MPTTALITGAAGRIGTMVRPLLRERGWRLRLLDVAPPPEPAPDEDVVVGSFLDRAVLDPALQGADVLVHLAAHASERPWSEILSLNIDGTRIALEAARDAGVRRVLLASSIHAVGFLPFAPVAGTPLPRPDSYYGVSKAASELLGSLFADRYGMSVVTARIVYAAPEADGPRGRVVWFSPADQARLIAAVAALEAPGHHVVWGASRGAERLFDLGPGRAIGFDPQDDVVQPGDLEQLPAHLGGEFTELPLGERWNR